MLKVCLRGHLRELFYNGAGEVTEVIDLAPGSDCVALNIPLGQWHTVEVLESGTVILECKDGAFVGSFFWRPVPPAFVARRVMRVDICP